MDNFGVPPHTHGHKAKLSTVLGELSTSYPQALRENFGSGLREKRDSPDTAMFHVEHPPVCKKRAKNFQAASVALSGAGRGRLVSCSLGFRARIGFRDGRKTRSLQAK